MTAEQDRKIHASMRLFSGLGAILLFGFALARYFDPAGFATHEYWWLMIVAFTIGVIGWTNRTEWQMTGVIAATFLLGFGAQLALKQPLWFQYIQFRPTSNFSYVLLSALALQGLTALYVLLRHDILKQSLRVISAFGWRRTILAFLLLCAGSMGVMDYITREQYIPMLEQLLVGSAFLGVNILSFIAVVMTVPARRLESISTHVTQSLSLPGLSDQQRPFDKHFPYWLAGSVFILCVFMRLVVFENIPRVDEITYVFQANYFAKGYLALPLPASLEAFDVFLMDSYEENWFAIWPPGWPLALAIGALFDLHWLVNPLLACLTILLFHFFVRSLIDRGMANLATLLMATSPWFLATSSSLMSHTALYFLILAAWCLLIKTHERPAFFFPLVAGALMGFAFLTRPLDGVLIGALTGLWILSFLKDRKQWKTPLLYGMGCIAIGGLVFPYNTLLTGSPLQAPVNVYFDKRWWEGVNDLGFGPNISPHNWGFVNPFPGHSPLEALIQAQQSFYALNFELFGWGIGSVFFVVLYAFWGKKTKLTVAMATITILTIGTFALYWFASSFYIGPRYWYLILIPMLILTAYGIVTCAKSFHDLFPNALAPERISVGIGFLCMCSILIFMNWLSFNKYHPEFRDRHKEYHTLAQQEGLKSSLLFVSSDDPFEYENAFWLNDFRTGSDQPLFARDLGLASNLSVASAYPEHTFYFVEGRSTTRDHIRITRGPMTHEELNALAASQ